MKRIPPVSSKQRQNNPLSRGQFISLTGLALVGLTIPIGSQLLKPTPACADADDLDFTPPQTEGPYYTPDTPLKNDFTADVPTGTVLNIQGKVFDREGKPIPAALLDFWHADPSGQYDNEGYRLRGHLFSREDGTYNLTTVVPGLYPGRTRHLHVKVQPPHQSVLTTQLYFPNQPENSTDGIFNEELLMSVADGETGKVAAFDFVMDVVTEIPDWKTLG